MSNSSLVTHTRISPNQSSRNGNKISKITIHHMAGNLSVEQCGNVFANASREASSNYGIGTDGRVGLYVDESKRSWASSSRANDEIAVTIEVANDGGAPDWHVSDKALSRTIELCVDICRRNGIKKLNFTGNANGNLTQHNYFAATACPGPYLKSKFQYIANAVNAALAPGIPTTPVNVWSFVDKYGNTRYIRSDEHKFLNYEQSSSVVDDKKFFKVELNPNAKFFENKNLTNAVGHENMASGIVVAQHSHQVKWNGKSWDVL